MHTDVETGGMTMGEAANVLAPDSRISLVDGAERAVRRWLTPGRFRPGDRLPPEQELAGMLGVSRGTLRSALRRLEDAGEIVRRQGSGTFVGSMGPPRGVVSGALRVDSYWFGVSGGYSVRDLTVELREAGETAARALDIGPGEHTTHLRRTVATGGKVTAIAEDVYHPSVMLPEVPELREMLTKPMTSWDVLSTTSTPPAISSTRITSLLLTPHDDLGMRLQLHAPTACLALEELACSERREPLLWSWDVVLPGGFEIEVLQSAVTVRPDRVAGGSDAAGAD
ncbi:MAG TPA: GntR family transcriptional regulator [Solirubrobacteraceae bacterium]